MISNRVKLLEAYKTETTQAKVKLSSNELSVDYPEELKDRIAKEVSRIAFNRYPDPTASELKEIVAERFGIRPENIMLGNGSDELIYYLSMSVGELSTGVFFPTPTFPMYEISAKALGRPLVCTPLGEDFDIDLEASLQAIEGYRPTLAYFSYPNNPTGNCFSKEKIQKIRSLGVFTVIDEAYYHFSKKTFLEEAVTREDTVVLRTLSKIGLAGLRVGVLIGKEEIVKELEKVRLPFNISSTSQVIAKLILRDYYHIIEEAVDTTIKEREKMLQHMSNMKGIKVYPSEANFILFKVECMSAQELHSRLLKEGVLVRNMSYLVDNALRVSVGKPQENEMFLEALQKVLV